MNVPMSKPRYYCPACNQKLSFLGGTLIKVVGRLHCPTFSARTMMYLPAKLGQYGAIVGEGVRIQEGAKVEFECTNGACKHNFTTGYDDNLAEIKLEDGEGREYVVVFSKTYGKHATFLIDFKNRALLESYGEDACNVEVEFDKPRNFFGQ